MGKVFDGRYRDPRSVFVDEQLQAVVADRVAQVKVWNESCSALWNRAWAAAQAVEAAWRKAAEHAAYRRFLEDYADPDLWEGHRKPLKLTYPHSSSGQHFSQTVSVPQLVWKAIVAAVEGGLRLDGLTVGQLVAQAGLVSRRCRPTWWSSLWATRRQETTTPGSDRPVRSEAPGPGQTRLVAPVAPVSGCCLTETLTMSVAARWAGVARRMAATVPLLRDRGQVAGSASWLLPLCEPRTASL